MKATKILWLCLAVAALFLSPALNAQIPVYFPLDAGNSWLYRLNDDQAPGESTFKTISVLGKEAINGREYFAVDYFGRSLLLRYEPDGTVLEYDRSTGAEQLWIALGLPEDSMFPTRVDQYVDSGEIASRNASVTTPAGNFDGAVEIHFQGHCADAGVTRQYYAPYIGLVRHEETSFAGPRVYDLVYFRAGSLTAGGQELSFTISLDAPRYQAGSNMAVRLTLRSTAPEPITLHFPSGQSYDLKIMNEQGQTVYVWSADKVFPMVVRDETFGPGERTYAITAPLNGLPPGRYRAQAFLTTDPSLFLAEASFEIVP